MDLPEPAEPAESSESSEPSEPSEGTEISDVLDATVDVADRTAFPLLLNGDIDVLGRMPWSSNGTFLVTVTAAEHGRCQGIYKPASGERPLWDFPEGLWRREVASYQLAKELGWEIIPPTVERDGPLGVGSLQFFVPSRFEEHYFTFRENSELRSSLEKICLFDLISNNTDRKAGHILLSDHGRLWGIDHGLSFHEEFKLRTVMWDFAGDPIRAEHHETVQAWVESPRSDELANLLSPAELAAIEQRAATVLTEGVFPSDPTGHRYPWPLV